MAHWCWCVTPLSATITKYVKLPYSKLLSMGIVLLDWSVLPQNWPPPWLPGTDSNLLTFMPLLLRKWMLSLFATYGNLWCPSVVVSQTLCLSLEHFIFQKETDVELGSLLRSEAQSVYNQLLLYLSVSYNKVFSGLAMLASKDDTYTGPKDLQTTQHLVRPRHWCWIIKVEM